MTTKKVFTDRGEVAEYTAERPYTVAPKELYRFEEDGVAYVYTTCGRTFIAARYDEVFNPPRTPVLPKGYKGPNPRPLELYEDDLTF